MKDSSIVIRPADKGSAIIVWDKEHYLRQWGNQLSDTSIYEKIGNSVFKKIIHNKI